MSFRSENVRSPEIEKSSIKLAFDDSFHFKPDYENTLPTYNELQSYLEDALRKQISLQYLLGIHKLHDIYQEKAFKNSNFKSFFTNLRLSMNSQMDLPKKEKEIALLKEHLNEEIIRLKTKQQDLELEREEIVLEPWDCLKDPNKLYERMMLKQEDLWKTFQTYKENSMLEYPSQERLWSFISDVQNSAEFMRYKEVMYQYQEFLMQEHVRLELLKEKLMEEKEKFRKEQNSFEKDRFNRLDYEIFEETKQKIKDELYEERVKLQKEKKKLNLLINIIKNYEYYKQNRVMDWESSNEEFIREIYEKINRENDIFEKDMKKKQQIKRLNDEFQRLFNDNVNEGNTNDPYEKSTDILGSINMHKECSQEDDIQKKLFRRKEEMLSHKQKELEALKKLLEKESIILQEEKVWLVNEKNKLGETTKKKIDVLKDENQQMREQLKTFKEQNTLQNISNIVPTNSNVKNKTLFRPESVTQLKIIDEFQLTEQFIMNPQMRKIALFTLAHWLDFCIDINITKPYIMKTLGFYKWRIHVNIQELQVNNDIGQISVDSNSFLKRKWMAQQANLVAQRRYPYNSLNKQRKALEESFFDYERKKFWKNRFMQVFGSIFRHRRRKEKLTYLVGFYKFCLNSLLHGGGSSDRFHKIVSVKQSLQPYERNYATNSNDKYEDPSIMIEKKKKAFKKTSNVPIQQLESPYMKENYTDVKENSKELKQNPKEIIQISKKIEGNSKEIKTSSKSIKTNSNIIKENYHNIIDNPNELKVSLKSERVRHMSIHQDFPIESSSHNSFEDLPKTQEKPSDSNRKLKGSLLICMFLIRKSIKNSTINRKGKVWIKWMRWIIYKERDLMNNELNDLNILLSEMVCRDNQRIMSLRLKKNDLDSRISILAQMMTCLKVNIFQKNIKKVKAF